MIEGLERIAPISGWLLVGVAFWLALVFEGARRLGLYRSEARVARKEHAANVLAGLITLMAFFLAFSFEIAESQFSARRLVVLEEANAIASVHRYAQHLPPETSAAIRPLLLEYVELRLAPSSASEVDERITRSMQTSARIWDAAAPVTRLDTEYSALFMDALDQMIKLNPARNMTTLSFRLPISIKLALLGFSSLALFAMGYTAGLHRAGDAVLTSAFVLSVAVALALVTDLDRPMQRTFVVDQRPLEDARDALEADVGR